jgi:hypothetical protein
MLLLGNQPPCRESRDSLSGMATTGTRHPWRLSLPESGIERRTLSYVN